MAHLNQYLVSSKVHPLHGSDSDINRSGSQSREDGLIPLDGSQKPLSARNKSREGSQEQLSRSSHSEISADSAGSGAFRHGIHSTSTRSRPNHQRHHRKTKSNSFGKPSSSRESRDGRSSPNDDDGDDAARRPRVTPHGLMLAEMRTKSSRKLQELEEKHSKHSRAASGSRSPHSSRHTRPALSASCQSTAEEESEELRCSDEEDQKQRKSGTSSSSTGRPAPRSRVAPVRTKSGGRSRRAAATERLLSVTRKSNATPEVGISATDHGLGNRDRRRTSTTSDAGISSTDHGRSGREKETDAPSGPRRIRSISLGRRTGAGSARRTGELTRTKSMDDSDIFLDSTTDDQNRGRRSSRQATETGQDDKNRKSFTRSRSVDDDLMAESSSGFQRRTSTSDHNRSRGRNSRKTSVGSGGNSSDHHDVADAGATARKPSTSSGDGNTQKAGSSKSDGNHRSGRATSSRGGSRPRGRRDRSSSNDGRRRSNSKSRSRSRSQRRRRRRPLPHDRSGAPSSEKPQQDEAEANDSNNDLGVRRSYSSTSEGLSMDSDIDESMELYGQPSSTRSNLSSSSSRPSKPRSFDKRRSGKPSSSNRSMVVPEEKKPTSNISINIDKPTSNTSTTEPDDDEQSLEFDVTASAPGANETEEEGEDLDDECGDDDNNNSSKSKKKSTNAVFSELLNRSASRLKGVRSRIASRVQRNNRTRSRSPTLVAPDSTSVRSKTRCLDELVRQTSQRKLDVDSHSDHRSDNKKNIVPGIPENSSLLMSLSAMTPGVKFGRPRLGNLLGRKLRNTMSESHALDDDDSESLVMPTKATPDDKKGRNDEEQEDRRCESFDEFFAAAAPVAETEAADGVKPSRDDHVDGEGDEGSLLDFSTDTAFARKKITASSSMDNLEALFFKDEDDSEISISAQTKMHQSMADMSRFVPLRQPSVRGGFDEDAVGNKPPKPTSALEVIPDSPIANSPKAKSPPGFRRSASLSTPLRRSSSIGPGHIESPRFTSPISPIKSRSPSRGKRRIILQADGNQQPNQSGRRTPPARSKSSEFKLGRNRTAPSRSRSTDTPDDLVSSRPRSPSKSSKSSRNSDDGPPRTSSLRRSKSGDATTRTMRVASPSRGGDEEPTSPRKSRALKKKSGSARGGSSTNDKQSSPSTQEEDSSPDLSSQALKSSSNLNGSDDQQQRPNPSLSQPKKPAFISLAEATPLPGEKQTIKLGSIMPVSLGGGFISPMPSNQRVRRVRGHRGDDDDSDSDTSYDYAEGMSPSVDNPTNYLQLAFNAPPIEASPVRDGGSSSVSSSGSSPTGCGSPVVSATPAKSKFPQAMSRLLKTPLVGTATATATKATAETTVQTANDSIRGANQPKKLPPLPPVHASK